MSNPLAKDFDFKSLLKFAMPTAIMMVLEAVAARVDGIVRAGEGG